MLPLRRLEQRDRRLSEFWRYVQCARHQQNRASTIALTERLTANADLEPIQSLDISL
jgi:hypothetical protein